MENSKISWTHHTFSPWIGCVEVSPGCTRCYARTFVTGRMQLPVWGPPKTTARRRTGDSTWKMALRWDRASQRAGERHRVFCASLADVFEEHPMVEPWRVELFDLIARCPNLDWLLLTKRPENFKRFLPPAWQAKPLPNVWIGTTVEDQKRADERIPLLLDAPAAVRFLSCEPLLEEVNVSKYLRRTWRKNPSCTFCDGEGNYSMATGALCPCGHSSRVDWTIVGGESGPGARRCDVRWIRSLVRQCKEAGTAAFVKQLGANVVTRNDDGFEAELDGGSPPTSWPTPKAVEENINGFREEHQGADVRVRLADQKGGAMEEWPADLRIREFPRP